MHALISVYDKNGITDVAEGLVDLGYKIISTKGTARFLNEHGINTIDVSDITGFPEMLSGRLKTLHPKIHAGILYDRTKSHAAKLEEIKAPDINVVIVNFYPFHDAVSKDLSLREMVEYIDIGGPTLVRSAAKNFEHVYVVVNPSDYPVLLYALRGNADALNIRKTLALKAWNYVSAYDVCIEKYFRSMFGGDKYPRYLNLSFEKIMDLRYGENPHQTASFYRDNNSKPSLADMIQLNGKRLSYNNVLDINSAVSLVREFSETTVVVVKHNNPCGVASDEDIIDAYESAKSVDPEASFGGIVAFNRPCTGEVADHLIKTFVDVVVAPDFSKDALSILKRKKNLRVIKFDVNYMPKNKLEYRSVLGGLLVQDNNTKLYDELKVVTKRRPTEDEMKSMLYAWKICKCVKSNAIVIARYGKAIGIGAGQQKRIDAAKLAAMIARDYSGNYSMKGAALASDAFFPFRDGVDFAHSLGITAIIQPGGSIRDKEVIEAADEHNIAMVFTGVRQFRH